MKKKNKIYLILAIISLIFCIYGTATTYAKYFTQLPGTQGYNIKRWNIILNNKDITNSNYLDEDITIAIDNQDHVADNQIAPDSTGSFIIDLDYTNVDLSFTYEITIKENENLRDLVIEKIEADGVPLATTDGTISGSVDIDSTTNKTQQIKVFVKWNDDDLNGATMNNKEDTEVAINNENVKFKIGIKLEQKN